jgi:Protein of unknown function (DUF1501)
MTFSEFGRTSHDNDGQGTDHGTAAPHFVFGQNVRGGIYGDRPNLAGLRQWDRMPHTVDFRTYYQSLIDGWLGGGGSSVLGGDFGNLNLFSRAPGVNVDGSPAPLPAQVSAPSTFVPVEPFRVLDTRDGTGGVILRPLNPGESIRVPVAGLGPIPPSGVTAVAANVTAVGATQPNFFTVYPGATARPGTSNINTGPGRPVPNLVVMGVGPDGTIEVYNAFGLTHCLVDVFGYYTAGAGERFTPVPPARLFDTRTGEGIRQGKIPSQTVVPVQVAGQKGVPPTGASAVVMNLTVTETESPGWMRATPSGQAAANTSNVNFFAGNTVPNLVICKIGPDGLVNIDGFGNGAHVLGDVFGYFGGTGSLMRTVAPKRMLDTREGLGAPKEQVGADPIQLSIGGLSIFPRNARAVIMNVTATNVTGPTFVTVWPDGEDMPGTSNLNAFAEQTTANLVICRLGPTGGLHLASPPAPCDVIADVLGYFVD